jgi:tripartite ATP-independent transporter DctM subunit
MATPTEAAAVGAVGATLLAAVHRELTLKTLREVVYRTGLVTAMVFMILIGASLFSLVFRGFGGDELITEFLQNLPGGAVAAMLVVMLVMFLLGFVLDFIEITFIVVPIVAPVLLAMGFDPVWLGVMMALNLQTSFLTPPFGFSLFYLRGVCPDSVSTATIYRGVAPFIAIQVVVLAVLALWPGLVGWLPDLIFGD